MHEQHRHEDNPQYSGRYSYFLEEGKQGQRDDKADNEEQGDIIVVIDKEGSGAAEGLENEEKDLDNRHLSKALYKGDE